MNVYNVMLKYSFCKLGVPVSEACRSTMLKEVKFNIAGFIFSFQEWVDGILRGNRKSPITKSYAFSKKDPRLPLASNIGKKYARDCRIHFGIHIWSRSRRSPPVKVFTPKGVDEELSFVARAFCEGDDNVVFSVFAKHIRVAEVFRRYKCDFLAGGKTLPQALLEFVHGPRKEKLAFFLTCQKSMKITSRKDDWTVGVNDFVPFDRSLLAPNVRKMQLFVRSTDQPTRKHDASIPPRRARSRSPSSRSPSSRSTSPARIIRDAFRGSIIKDSLPKAVSRRKESSCDNSDRTLLIEDCSQASFQFS